MTAPLAEQVAAALGEHDWLTPRGYAWPCCTCGEEFPGGEDDAQAHQADAVLRVVAEWLGVPVADLSAERPTTHGEPAGPGEGHSGASEGHVCDEACSWSRAWRQVPARPADDAREDEA